ncbi:MAG: hypothetical protein PHC66_02110 [Candidatus Nanoarchaeia archaeon]|nr:hypothetical protein [Candidatus Nanoarchaeia archaeon]MDD5239731.1 hypothetical protein [Candidatus Nanoarchaeia archaeon]
MAKKVNVTPKQIVHIVLIFVLFAGSLFAWYNSFKETGLFCGAQTCATCATATMLGVPICVIGAIFFTIALVLAAALWFVE